MGIVEALRHPENRLSKARCTNLMDQAASEIERLTGDLEYAYHVVNFGFKYGSFDMSVLRQNAEAYAKQIKPE